MSHYGGWAPYVSVAERRKKAEGEMAKLRKKGHTVSPVIITGRTIATTFWGKAWCETMESFGDYESRLPRGRTYVRNGSVVDLQISPLHVKAWVSGSSLYTVTIAIKPVPKPQWQSLCRDCAGGIDSLVDLLQGRLSKAVMERICAPGTGLFPKSSEITFACTCPDGAYMCKHVAAVLYGIGARLDEKPNLLFHLRAVDHQDLVAGLGKDLPLTQTAPASARILEADDMVALFGLDMATPDDDVPAATPTPPRRKKPVPAAKPAVELTEDGYVKWWK